MSSAVASTASFEFACYQAQDVSIKMSDWAHGLSPLIYNKSNKLKFGLFMGRHTHTIAVCYLPFPFFLNVKGISAAKSNPQHTLSSIYVNSILMAECEV